MSDLATSGYMAGHSDRERRRLVLQASVINPLTEQLFRRAGIGPGMKVLDIGSGVGDVALISARLGATVTAVDMDSAALAVAAERAAAEGFGNITFLNKEVTALDLPAIFDAVTGRHILLHLPDPAAMVCSAARFLKPGGVAVFQEYDFSVMHPSYPQAPLRDQLTGMWRDFFVKLGKESMGSRLFHLFHDAGLHSPDCRVEYPIMGGPESPCYELLAESFRSILPAMKSVGVVGIAGIDVDSLENTLR